MKTLRRSGLTLLLLAAVAGLAWWAVAMIRAHSEPKDYLSLVIALGAVIVTYLARQDSRRSAAAAEKSAELAQQNELRNRNGWTVALHPNGSQYVLRNVGTAPARSVRLVNTEDFADLRFVRHQGEDFPTIMPGEAKAFIAIEAFGRTGTEVVIEWTPDGETHSRRHNDVLPPTPNRIAEIVKERGAQRAAEEAAYDRDVAETRRRLLELADAWGAYLAEKSNPAKKIRVQAIVSALPSNYVKEIGYAVDVPRDYWGPDQWPFELFVDAGDREIVARDAPIIELIWNLRDVQLGRVAHVGRSAQPRDWIRIEHAIFGYLELVHRRERADRELIEAPDDRQHREEAQQRLRQFTQRFDASNPVD